MKKVLVLHHQNDMKWTKEFMQIKVPSEVFATFSIVIFFFATLIGIIVFGKIDDVIKVSGLVRTQENVSNVANVISGKILELHYSPGQEVNRGDFLYRIDPTIYNAERENLVTENKTLSDRLYGIEKLLMSFEVRKNLISRADKVSWSRFESYLRTSEEYEIKREMAKRDLEIEKSRPQSLKNPSLIEKCEMELRYIEGDIKSFDANFLQTLHAEKEELSVSYEKNKQNICRLDSQYEFLSVFAPQSGFVQENSSLNVGDYVEAGKNVLSIVPNDSVNFRVELQASPKDVGKIKLGMQVKYRLSAFPYFEYKGADGKIISIDPDVRSVGDGRNFYCIYADIDRVQFENRHGESFPIRAGLETDARIVTKNNSILYFILKKLDFLC